MYRVYTYSKCNGQRVEVIAKGLTEKQAESFCESWGWNYCREDGCSFWIDYEWYEEV